MTEQSAAQKLVGDISPKLADLTDDVLFGDVWEREALAKRDRSLITIASLVTSAITHLAFYAGWPKAMSAVQIAREVFED